MIAPFERAANGLCCKCKSGSARHPTSLVTDEPQTALTVAAGALAGRTLAPRGGVFVHEVTFGFALLDPKTGEDRMSTKVLIE